MWEKLENGNDLYRDNHKVIKHAMGMFFGFEYFLVVNHRIYRSYAIQEFVP